MVITVVMVIVKLLVVGMVKAVIMVTGIGNDCGNGNGNSK